MNLSCPYSFKLLLISRVGVQSRALSHHLHVVIAKQQILVWWLRIPRSCWQQLKGLRLATNANHWMPSVVYSLYHFIGDFVAIWFWNLNEQIFVGTWMVQTFGVHVPLPRNLLSPRRVRRSLQRSLPIPTPRSRPRNLVKSLPLPRVLRVVHHMVLPKSNFKDEPLDLTICIFNFCESLFISHGFWFPSNLIPPRLSILLPRCRRLTPGGEAFWAGTHVALEQGTWGFLKDTNPCRNQTQALWQVGAPNIHNFLV